MPDLNKFVAYFDLQESARQTQVTVKGGSSKRLHVVPQYFALVLGIGVQPFLAKFHETGVWDLTGWTGWLIFSAIAGFLIFPGVYKNALDPNKPLFVQLCAIFASGIGWQSLLEAAGKPFHVS